MRWQLSILLLEEVTTSVTSLSGEGVATSSTSLTGGESGHLSPNGGRTDHLCHLPPEKKDGYLPVFREASFEFTFKIYINIKIYIYIYIYNYIYI